MRGSVIIPQQKCSHENAKTNTWLNIDAGASTHPSLPTFCSSVLTCSHKGAYCVIVLALMKQQQTPPFLSDPSPAPTSLMNSMEIPLIIHELLSASSCALTPRRKRGGSVSVNGHNSGAWACVWGWNRGRDQTSRLMLELLLLLPRLPLHISACSPVTLSWRLPAHPSWLWLSECGTGMPRRKCSLRSDWWPPATPLWRVPPACVPSLLGEIWTPGVSTTTIMGCNLCTLQKREEHYKLLYEIAQVSWGFKCLCWGDLCGGFNGGVSRSVEHFLLSFDKEGGGWYEGLVYRMKVRLK